MKKFITVLFCLIASSQASYLCQNRFIAIGRKCYFFSKEQKLWDDAYYKCRDLNSTLARVNKPEQELQLRKYLNRSPDGKFERWLGGRYNERQLKWVWGENGKPLEFQAFSRMNPKSSEWSWHCTITDPEKQNKWSARSCIERKRYICQSKILGKRKSNRSKCSSGSSCTSSKLGGTEPGYLVKPIKRYNVDTFICPPHMILVGRKCYFFSKDKATWLNAYWACRDMNNTKLAVLTSRIQDNILRGFLNAQFTAEKHERWIGAEFDHKQNKWKWAMSGKIVKYKNFAKEVFENQKNNTHHCVTLDPYFNNFWNSKNSFKEKHYICQAKSQSVVKYNKLSKNSSLQSNEVNSNKL